MRARLVAVAGLLSILLVAGSSLAIFEAVDQGAAFAQSTLTATVVFATSAAAPANEKVVAVINASDYVVDQANGLGGPSLPHTEQALAAAGAVTGEPASSAMDAADRAQEKGSAVANLTLFLTANLEGVANQAVALGATVAANSLTTANQGVSTASTYAAENAMAAASSASGAASQATSKAAAAQNLTLFLLSGTPAPQLLDQVQQQTAPAGVVVSNVVFLKTTAETIVLGAANAVAADPVGAATGAPASAQQVASEKFDAASALACGMMGPDELLVVDLDAGVVGVLVSVGPLPCL